MKLLRFLQTFFAIVSLLGVATASRASSLKQAEPSALAHWLAEVHQYGAVGDGVADDSAAIQKAVNSGEPIYLPSYYNGLAQRYRVAHSINCTNRGGPTVFFGDQLGEFNRSGPHGTTIIMQTGARPAFDTAGSQDIEFRDLSLVAMDPSASTIAIFEARSRAVLFAQNHRYQNVNIYMYSDPRANQGHGRIGIYNYGAELWSAYDLHIEADLPLFFSSQNELRVAGAAPIVSSPQSMAGAIITGESSLIAYAGPAIYLGGDVAMLDFGQTFIAENPTYAGAHSPFVIVARGRVRGLRYSGNVENLHQLLWLSGDASGLELSGAIAALSGAPIIELHSAPACPSVSDSSIRLRLAVPGVETSLFSSGPGAACFISGSIVELPAGLKAGLETRAGGNLVFGLGAAVPSQ